MADQWNDNIPLVGNDIGNDIPDLNENLTYLHTLAENEYKSLSDTSTVIGKSGRYYVDSTEADHGVAGSGRSVKDLVDAIGTTKNATLVFAHKAADGNTTTYQFKTAETIPANISVVAEAGVRITTDYSICDAGSAYTWTVSSGSVYALGQTIPQPNFVKESGVKLKQKLNAAAVTAAGEWAFEGGVLYVWTTGSVDPDSLTSGTLKAAATLTVNGTFNHGLKQAFSNYSSIVFGDTSCNTVHPEWWGATCDTSYTTMTSSSSFPLRAAWDTGKRVFLSGIYWCNRELLIINHGQTIDGIGGGWGTNATDYVMKCGIVLYTQSPANSQEYIKTRRVYRSGSGSAQDGALSTGIHIQAEGVQLRNFCVYLQNDYTDTTALEYGADWDVGVFNGCRPGLRTENLHIVGHFRHSNYYHDVTRASNLDELVGPDGVSFPEGTVAGGSDYTDHINPLWVGGRWCEAHLGALRDPADADYYDQTTGAAVTDYRGSSGSSDYYVTGGSFAPNEHASGYRWTDPGAVNPLTTVAYDAETLSSGAIYKDAYAGIAAKRITKQVYNNCRFRSAEPFNCRLDHVGNIRFNNSHWEWGVSTITPAAGGSAIDPSDTDNYGYGTIAATENTGSVSLYHPSTNTPAESWFWDIVATTGDAVRMLVAPEDGANRMDGGRSGYHASMTIDGDYRGRSYVSYNLDLDDNEAAAIDVGTRLGGLAFVSSNQTSKPHFAFAFRTHSTAASNFCDVWPEGTTYTDMAFDDNAVLTTGAPPTGGGTDAKLNVSVSQTDATGNNLYFKNCLGSSVVLNVTILGAVSVPPTY